MSSAQVRSGEGLEGEVRYGTAGWSFPDWYGSFYPSKKSSSDEAGPGSLFTGVLEREDPDLGLAKREPLRYYARFFDFVEVNASFYGVPKPETANRWAELTEREPSEPSFLFSAKVPQAMTHERAIVPREVEAFRDFLAPLRDRERLVAVLAQFPGSCAWGEGSKALLGELREVLAGLPLVAEVRHASWLRDEALAFLRDQELSLASIDMPQSRDTLPPSELVTAPRLGYVRLHGRNHAAWFDRKSTRDQRYDYLYGPDELDGWARRIGTIAKATQKTLVVANNHYRGQAPANALELRRLAGESAPAPATLARTYPRLGGAG